MHTLQDRRGVRGVDGEARLDGARALHEQRHGVRSQQRLRRGLSILGQRQRRHVDHDLAGDPERLPAGREDPDVGTGAQQRSGEDGRGIVDVLAVVEDQQRPLVREVLGEGGDRPARRVVLEPERREHGLRDELGILDGRQLDEPDAVGVLADALPAGPQCELGLADAAGTGECQQPGRGQRALELGETLTASHEARQFDWQVAGTLVGSGGRQGPPSLVL